MRKPGRPNEPASTGESPWSRARVARPDHAPRAQVPRTERVTPPRRAEHEDSTPREIRLYGLNACLAAFAKRPHALRKVYLTETRIAVLKPVLAWCVKHRLGYRVVEDEDLDKLAASRHHEGVCFEMQRATPTDLATLIAAQPQAPASSLLLWLDGVGNPHNLGALLRSAAHFGVAGAVVPDASTLDVSGAAARVAEGAAEIVPIARAPDAARTRDVLRAAGYTIVATVPRDGTSLYETALPARLAFAFGAEGEGMSRALIDVADLRLTIPGSGAIESLNVAASVAVVLGEYWRQQHARTTRDPKPKE